MTLAAVVTEGMRIALWKGIQNCRRIQWEFTDAKPFSMKKKQYSIQLNII